MKKRRFALSDWLLVTAAALLTGVAVARVIQVFAQPIFDVASALLSR